MLGKPFLLFLILFHCSRHLPFSCAIPDLFTTRDLPVSPAYVPSNYLPVDSFKDFVLVGTRPQSGSQLESPVCLAFLSVLHRSVEINGSFCSRDRTEPRLFF
jgi:hypothetical protein